jgi:hypothetical protein
MIKNYFYSIFLHFLLLLLIFFSFRNKSITKHSDQQLFVSFEHLISESTLSDLKTAKEQEILQQKKIDKLIEHKKIISTNQDNLGENLKTASPEEGINKDLQKKVEENNLAKIEEKKAINENKNISEDNSKKKSNDINKDVKSIEDSGLSSREKLNILSQLKMCYHHAISESKKVSNLKFIVEVEISKDGYILSKIDSLIDKKRYLNPLNNDYKSMIDNVKKALELCSPLRNLPIEKYEMWKNLILNFENE